MRFVSTRGGVPGVSLSEAITLGAAADGGLFVPERLPQLDDAPKANATLAEAAACVLAPYFAGDKLEASLQAICREAFTFASPLVPLGTAGASILQLFHGPTASFKDFGARFLAACFRRLAPESESPFTILVATSGDTGSAVAAAFHRAPNARVVVLYPDGRVSPRQAHQLGCFGGNVVALRIADSFDVCQQMVKAAFADGELSATMRLTSANSISLGRLLPQLAFHAYAAWAHGARLNLIIPTGNLGNALAATWAREMGVPLGQIVLSTNANRVLPDFFAGGDYHPRPGVATLANAMDVGRPSNFERLRWTFPVDSVLRSRLKAFAVEDGEIKETIRQCERRYGQVLCPHTATAVRVLERIRPDSRDWAVVATAHPAKFEQVVEPLIGHPVAVPENLEELLARSAHSESLVSDAEALKQRLLNQGIDPTNRED